LKRQGKSLLLARVKDRPREALLRMGLVNASAGGLPLFWSVDDVARATAKACSKVFAAELSPARH
ncbi:MAG: hypothetical protein ABIR56_09080, partial [Polaromonas sp.]